MPPLPPSAPQIDAVGQTARWVAAARAAESQRADRLFDDPYAGVLAGPDGLALLRMMGPGAAAVSEFLARRTRFLDDVILEAVGAGGLRQLVILAAGMDARAYRLPLPEGVTIFELDRPEVLAVKGELLDGIGALPAGSRHAIGADLTKPWRELLLAAGFTPDQPSVWLVEGLLPYLHAEEVERLLTDIDGLCAPGSRLGLDVPDPPIRQADLPLPQGYQVRWHFGSDDPAGLLAGHGWQATVTDPDDYGRRFGRPAMPPVMMPGAGRLRNHLVEARR